MIIRQARPEDATGIARVHVQTWQTTYRGIIPDSYLDTIQAEEWRERWTHDLSVPVPHTFSFVAEYEENHEIAGFVHGGVTRYPELPYQGELYAIYILKEYQQHGLGRLLVRSMGRSLLNAGIPDMLLWVFEANLAARRFYEMLGGQYVRTSTFELHGAQINECAYAWTNLAPFLQEEQHL